MSKQGIRIFLFFLLFSLFFLSPQPVYTQEACLTPGQCGVKFVVAGHVYPGLEYPKLLKTFVDQVNDLEVDALFLLGDSISVSTRKNWETLEKILARLEIPYYFTPGNHDFEGENGRQLWQERVGDVHQSVSINDYKFILLNTTPEEGKYRLDEEEIKFLKQELIDYQDYQQVFLMFHHELWLYPYIGWEKTIYPLIKDKVSAVFAGNGASYYYSQFPQDKKLKYFLTGFPFRKNYKRKPTFLLVTVESNDLKAEPFLVALSADDPFYEVKPPQEKTLIEKIQKYRQGLPERVYHFGKKLLIGLLGLFFILGFLTNGIFCFFQKFLKEIRKKK